MKRILIGVVVCTLLLGMALNTYAQQWIVTGEQAQQAFDYGMSYVQSEVPYRYGGRQTVEQYQTAAAASQKDNLGVDSSGMVINAYRSVIPEMRFWTDSNMSRAATDVSSSTLYYHNSRQISLDEAVSGDLIFFQSASGQIMGVGLFSHLQGEVAHFIVASANAGKVILTNAHIEGDYWKNSVAGIGRLQYSAVK